MLELSFLRQNKNLVKDRLSIKNFLNIEIVDNILIVDDQRRKLQSENDAINTKINLKSKQIKKLSDSKDFSEIEKIKNEVYAFKKSITKIEQELKSLEKQQKELLLLLPNIPSERVPVGHKSTDNVLEKTSDIENLCINDAFPHWDLCAKYNLINFELGNKITGSGFPFYVNKGAKLLRALIQYCLDYNVKAGYNEYVSPLLVNKETAFGTGQLPDKDGQMYFITGDELYLIPTAELTLTNIYRDVIIDKKYLPIKLTGHTQCFRREAGSYGKDVRGLNRLHQFDKVEIVQIVDQNISYDVLDSMVLHVEELIKSLELPYRILKLCGGDMGFASALTYDFEVFSMGQNKWLEVSSVSNFESFQTNRMKIRTKEDNGKTKLLHSLNGSSLALPRIISALLENNQKKDKIILPKVLHKYFGDSEIN